MFLIFHGNVLIGRSELESGDPPMGVAYGRFEPTDDFAPLRSAMQPAVDGQAKERHDIRYIAGLSAKTVEGTAVVCPKVEVFEYGELDNPFALEVFCTYIDYPLYEQLFPHHVKAYYGNKTEE